MSIITFMRGIVMGIGDRVKEQRAKSGISQQKLANEIGITVDMIRSIEINRANPSVDTLSKLAQFFGCSTDYLLGITDKSSFVVIETWEQFHEYVDFALDLIKMFSVDHAKSIRLAARKFPRTDDPIPDEEEGAAKDFLKRTLDILERVKKEAPSK